MRRAPPQSYGCNSIHRERRSLRSPHRLAPGVAYRDANVPGSALVHIQRSSLGTAQEVDLPRCRLVATSRIPSRLRGGRTPRSPESGTHTCGSSDQGNTRAPLGSALQRRGLGRTPSLAVPTWLRCSLHLRTPTLWVPPDRGSWRTRSATPSGSRSCSPRVAARTTLL